MNNKLKATLALALAALMALCNIKTNGKNPIILTEVPTIESPRKREEKPNEHKKTLK